MIKNFPITDKNIVTYITSFLDKESLLSFMQVSPFTRHIVFNEIFRTRKVVPYKIKKLQTSLLYEMCVSFHELNLSEDECAIWQIRLLKILRPSDAAVETCCYARLFYLLCTPKTEQNAKIIKEMKQELKLNFYFLRLQRVTTPYCFNFLNVAALCSGNTKIILENHDLKQTEKFSRQLVSRHSAHPLFLVYIEKIVDLINNQHGTSKILNEAYSFFENLISTPKVTHKPRTKMEKLCKFLNAELVTYNVAENLLVSALNKLKNTEDSIESLHNSSLEANISVYYELKLILLGKLSAKQLSEHILTFIHTINQLSIYFSNTNYKPSLLLHVLRITKKIPNSLTKEEYFKLLSALCAITHSSRDQKDIFSPLRTITHSSDPIDKNISNNLLARIAILWDIYTEKDKSFSHLNTLLNNLNNKTILTPLEFHLFCGIMLYTDPPEKNKFIEDILSRLIIFLEKSKFSQHGLFAIQALDEFTEYFTPQHRRSLNKLLERSYDFIEQFDQNNLIKFSECLGQLLPLYTNNISNKATFVLLSKLIEYDLASFTGNDYFRLSDPIKIIRSLSKNLLPKERQQLLMKCLSHRIALERKGDEIEVRVDNSFTCALIGIFDQKCEEWINHVLHHVLPNDPPVAYLCFKMIGEELSENQALKYFKALTSMPHDGQDQGPDKDKLLAIVSAATNLPIEEKYLYIDWLFNNIQHFKLSLFSITFAFNVLFRFLSDQSIYNYLTCNVSIKIGSYEWRDFKKVLLDGRLKTNDKQTLNQWVEYAIKMLESKTMEIFDLGLNIFVKIAPNLNSTQIKSLFESINSTLNSDDNKINIYTAKTCITILNHYSKHLSPKKALQFLVDLTKKTINQKKFDESDIARVLSTSFMSLATNLLRKLRPDERALFKDSLIKPIIKYNIPYSSNLFSQFAMDCYQDKVFRQVVLDLIQKTEKPLTINDVLTPDKFNIQYLVDLNDKSNDQLTAYDVAARYIIMHAKKCTSTEDIDAIILDLEKIKNQLNYLPTNEQPEVDYERLGLLSPSWKELIESLNNIKNDTPKNTI